MADSTTSSGNAQDAIAQGYAAIGSPETSDSPDAAIAQGYDILKSWGQPAPQAPQAPATPVSHADSFLHGLSDVPVGLGQAAEHILQKPLGIHALQPLNWIREGIHGTLNAAGAPNAASLFQPVSTNQFDQIVAQREQRYQAQRAAAGQKGIDWWRLAGDAADPINYAGGLASDLAAPETIAGRIGQTALQGAAINSAMPSTSPGNFWEDKAADAGLGAVTGGATAGAIETAVPAIRAGARAAISRFGRSAASAAQAGTIVNRALEAGGVDPTKLNLDVLAGLRSEVGDALQHGEEPDMGAVRARAEAESLPVPIQLTRGQATGNAMQFAREQNLRGIEGVGERVTNRLKEQNDGFIANLDALGAKDAPDPVSTGHIIGAKVQKTWDAIQARKNALYAAVRNSSGQSAEMDGFSVARGIREALDTPEASHAWDHLPAGIQRTVDDLADGKLSLTVGQMQALDKTWGAMGASADGTTAHAVGIARRILNNADVSEDVGDEARKMYQSAKALHAQQMSMVEPKLPNGLPNPAYQPLMKSVVVDGTAPEKLFALGFGNAPASVAAKNLSFLRSIDPESDKLIGTTLMGDIKSDALNDKSAERGTVSAAKILGWARDPVKAARMRAILPQDAYSTFQRLANTVERAKVPPVASAVNTSNTGSAIFNSVAKTLKSNVATQIVKRLPIIKQLVLPVQEGLSSARVQGEVQSALDPGVTLKSLLSGTPRQRAAMRIGERLALPTVLGATQRRKDR